MQSNKVSTLLIILLLAASTVLMVEPSLASGSTPSIPQFTVAYIDHSYDIPPTYGKDPYTGQTITTDYGRHVDNRTIDITVQNQPFTSYMDSNNKTVGLFYSVRSKGHFDDWSASSFHSTSDIPASTASSSTVISIDFGSWGVQQGGQIDFQVSAVTGYTSSDANYCGYSYNFNTVSQSDWSEIQTITIGNPVTATPTQPPYNYPTPTMVPYGTDSPQPTATSTPNPPNILSAVLLGGDLQQTVLVVMAVIIVVLAVALVVVLWRKARR
jgi:hypothetical protein